MLKQSFHGQKLGALRPTPRMPLPFAMINPAAKNKKKREIPFQLGSHPRLGLFKGYLRFSDEFLLRLKLTYNTSPVEKKTLLAEKI